MHRARLSLAAAVILAACRPASPAPLDAAHAAAIDDSVRQSLDTFLRLSAASRYDSLGALYSDDARFRFLESGAVQYRSAADVRAALKAVPPGMTIRTVQRDVEVVPLAPGLAHATALFETTFADSTGPRFSFGGALSLLWRHEAAGWRILAGHSSAPVPRGSF
jgi:ketosteroid isomerase-like protein